MTHNLGDKHQIGAVCRWTRTAPGKGFFKIGRRFQHPEYVRGVEGLTLLLLQCFPELLALRGYYKEVCFQAIPRDHPVVATLRGQAPTELEINTTVTGAPWVEPVTSHFELTNKLTRSLKPEVAVTYVHPHPKLSRLVCLWAGRRRWAQKRSVYKQRVLAAKHKRGTTGREERAAKWEETSQLTAEGLNSLTWKQIRRVEGQTAWEEQLLFRLKLRALSLHNVTTGRKGCPHHSCTVTPNITLEHVFWTYPATTRLRKFFLQQWAKMGFDLESAQGAIFGLNMPSIPDVCWKVLRSTRRADPDFTAQAETEFAEMLTACWWIGASTYLQAAWRWRILHFDSSRDISVGAQVSALRHRLRDGYIAVQTRMRRRRHNPVGKSVAAAVNRALATDGFPIYRHVQRNVAIGYILAIAGLTTGDGNHGAVVVQVDYAGNAGIITWLGRMSYRRTRLTRMTTEHKALLLGIKACEQHRLRPIQVVSSSSTLMRQHSQRRPPRAPHLVPIYWNCRRIVERCGQVTWVHHPKEDNRGAHLLAKGALDTGKSAQSRIDGGNVDAARWGRTVTTVLQLNQQSLTLANESCGCSTFLFFSSCKLVSCSDTANLRDSFSCSSSRLKVFSLSTSSSTRFSRAEITL